MTSERVDDLLVLAVETARAAGAELLRRYGRIEGLETKSTATDPVSDADRASERLIVDALAKARPDDAILGEEGTSRPGTSGIRWVVDPLDGTVNYLYGIDGWAVSIAAEDGDGRLVGVVHQPAENRIFSATRGGGAFVDRQRLRANDPVRMQQALLATGFSYRPDRRAAIGGVIAGLLPQVRDIRRLGTASVDLCMVAAGMVDAYFEEGLNPWDVAAGALIATEAGAAYDDVLATPAGGQGMLAAGPALQPILRAAIEKLVAAAAV
ncbi:MAG: inositol monophosphatase family protein [Mycobacteriales bacterium]